jgi:hypothetical protein
VGSRAALARLKGMAAAGSHTWLRLALISGDKSAAALFDDLSLAGVARGATKRAQACGHSGSTSAQWVATIQAAGGLVRTNIPMKNTILRIALTNKKQVRAGALCWGAGGRRRTLGWRLTLHTAAASTHCCCCCCPCTTQVLIPDVQKLINQLGNVNTDLFASRLLRPPSSVLLLPLRASGVGACVRVPLVVFWGGLWAGAVGWCCGLVLSAAVCWCCGLVLGHATHLAALLSATNTHATGIYGALYCLADVHTEFSEVAKQLKEVAELLGLGLNRQLGGALVPEYLVRQRQ